ncbi:MAG: [FeFe] hydrogenase H-cluster maturation GTPase HydF [Treponema sp.]|nr:[FeFe] hydrogenase H-cluster maturation GTPase HydF [Treponema sp.]
MKLNETPSGSRIHIAFFGRRNAGKSSLVNALTSQQVSLVSAVKGTTTDPVQRPMELLPLGPAVIIDTPGTDDEGELGMLRVERTRETLSRTDIAVLAADAAQGLSAQDEEWTAEFSARKIPFIVAYNKADLLPEIPRNTKENEVYVSALTGWNMDALREKIGSFAGTLKKPRRLLEGLISAGDMGVLVIPVDESAPKGRIILPQQQAIREILDAHASFAACRPEELPQTLSLLSKKPALVITDSQAFASVARNTPPDIPLTSFSILLARAKGDLPLLVRGAQFLSSLKDGDTVLVSEACTHRRQCRDIGTVQIPALVRKFSGAQPRFVFSSGAEFPQQLEEYALIIHCGGCMITETEMKSRLARAQKAGTPIVNYGIALAQMNGILERSIAPFRAELEVQ